MRLLVYGGLHQLGAHVVAAARHDGHEVFVWDFSRSGMPRQQDVADETVHLITYAAEKDASLATPPPGLDAVDAVVFCGVDPYPDDSASMPSGGRLAVERAALDAILASGPDALVLTSTESGAPLEDHCRVLEGAAIASGVSVIVLRYAPVVGSEPGVSCVERCPKINLMLPEVRAVSGDFSAVDLEIGEVQGPQGRHVGGFVHAADAADACLLAAYALAGGEAGGSVLDVSTPDAPTTGQVLQIMRASEVLRVDEGAACGIPVSGEAMPTAGGPSARDALGWRPLYTHEEWLADEVDSLHAAWVDRHSEHTAVKVTHEFLGSAVSHGALRFFGLLLVDDRTGTLRNTDIRFVIQKKVYQPRVLSTRGIPMPFSRIRVSPYVVEVPLGRIADFPTHTNPRFAAVLPDGRMVRRRLVYSYLRRKARFLRGRLHHIVSGDSTLYVRQSARNRLNITFRTHNRTDDIGMAPVIALAALAARVVPRKTVLLYEKHSSHYEESASTLFERLIDSGRHEARFVLERDAISAVPEKYRPYVVERFSFAHFYRFFCATALLGTEAAAHAAELRTANRILLRRIFSRRFGYVFLQHGVMYMVALSAGQRKEFRADGIVFPLGTKIVCSSQKEARHFVELGGFPAKDMYVSGLPKFDRAVRDEDADLILIMPTWRPWEHNIVRTAPQEAPYFKMLVTLYEAMPEELRERVRILPHPLLRDTIKTTSLARHMWSEGSYDEALRRCAVLVTDYSSISYDAFYRGSGVVFWWRDKDECMRRYQGHLMLDGDSAFGPVCFEPGQLTAAVRSLYRSAQDAEYVRRYRELVEFHDNCNTDRLVAMLEKDGLI